MELYNHCTSYCKLFLGYLSSYGHVLTDIPQNKILQALISESKPTGDTSTSSPYKFAVNSTIIQHLSDPRATGTDNSEVGSESSVGRRGMHSAAGAYWNNEKDGMWSFKYEGGEKIGMDVVVSIMWIAI